MDYLSHKDGIFKDGDLSSYGEIGNSSGKNREKRDYGVNSKKYHFHINVQELEDGIYEQFKEQNKNFNKDRVITISSVSDAMYRKLYTSLIYPISMNLLFLLVIYIFVPIFLSIDFKYSLYLQIATYSLFLFLIANIYFDAYVVYRIKKYVIEQVTQKYYKIIKASWRSFEILFLMISALFFILSFYAMSNEISMDVSNKYLIKITSYINYDSLKSINLYISPTLVITYFLFIKLVNKKAERMQKRAIIESKKSSEHNADVAESILSGEYLNINTKSF